MQHLFANFLPLFFLPRTAGLLVAGTDGQTARTGKRRDVAFLHLLQTTQIRCVSFVDPNDRLGLRDLKNLLRRRMSFLFGSRDCFVDILQDLDNGSLPRWLFNRGRGFPLGFHGSDFIYRIL
jgi:hypothetical protein